MHRPHVLHMVRHHIKYFSAFHNGLIADDYLMPISLLAMLVVILGINPLLKRCCPRLSFSRRWLCIIFGVLFMAALPPSAGMLRQLAFPLGASVYRANTDLTVADAYRKLTPRESLFPDSMEFEADLPVIDPFIDKLDPGEKVPRSARVAPMAA